MFLDENYWDLRANHTFDEFTEDSYDSYSDEEDNDDEELIDEEELGYDDEDDDDSEGENGSYRVMAMERPDDDGDVEIDEEVIDNALRENYRQAVISYSQMYGQERGTYLAGIVTRMQEISMKGLMETTAQEYNELVIEMQRVMLGAI